MLEFYLSVAQGMDRASWLIRKSLKEMGFYSVYAHSRGSLMSMTLKTGVSVK